MSCCHECASTFGNTTSESSRFIRADQASLVRSLESPCLRPGETYCLRTRPLCGQVPEVAYLCVGHCIDCRPEILPVYLVKLDDVTNPCNPCSSIPNNPTFYWNNARGTIVIFEEVCESNYENALLLGFMDNVIEWDSGEYLPPGALKACRGKLTALEVVKDSRASSSECCSTRRKCVFYATKMSSVCSVEESCCNPSCSEESSFALSL